MWQILRRYPAAYLWSLLLHLGLVLFALFGIDWVIRNERIGAEENLIQARVFDSPQIQQRMAELEAQAAERPAPPPIEEPPLPQPDLEATRRAAEEQARREAEEAARRAAEEQSRREAEEAARRAAEEQARREAEEAARRAAEEQARREAEEAARRAAEEEIRRRTAEEAERRAAAEAQRRAEQEARRQEALEQARREAEERTRREAEERARREAAERRAEAEAERKLEEARQRAQAEARRQVEEERRREQELLEALAAEARELTEADQRFVNEQRARQLASKYVPMIEARVRSVWLIPPGLPPGMKGKIRIDLEPGGQVIPGSVKVVRSSGNAAFDQSVIAAVYKASPLPVPDGDEFNIFRSFDMEFEP